MYTCIEISFLTSGPLPFVPVLTGILLVFSVYMMWECSLSVLGFLHSKVSNWYESSLVVSLNDEVDLLPYFHP